MEYVEEYSTRERYLYLNAKDEPVTAIAGYDYMINVSADGLPTLAAGPDTIAARYDTSADILHVRLGSDSLRFDLGQLADTLAREQATAPNSVPADRLRLLANTPTRKAALAIQSLNGRRTHDSVSVDRWNGKLFLGRR
jgi:hypothetical protein